MVRNITVYLDCEQVELKDRVRCGFIVAQDEAGEETFHNDLIDSFEYPSIRELVDDITGIFGIHRDDVLVAA